MPPIDYTGSEHGDVFPVTVSLPANGEPRDAASVGTGLEGIADRTQYLWNRRGAFRLIEHKIVSVEDASDTIPVFVSFTGGSYTYQLMLSLATATLAGDIVETFVHLAGVVSSGSSGGFLRACDKQNGGAATQLLGCNFASNPLGIDVSGPTNPATWVPVTFVSKRVITTPGTYDVGIQGRVASGVGGSYLRVQGAYATVSRLWRAQ